MSASASDAGEQFHRAAAGLLARFERLWQLRDPELIREIVAPDAESHWSGAGAVRGDQYPERWRALVHDAVDDLDFEITGHAAQEPYLFVSWHARATAGGRSAEWDGVDRFRLRGDIADEVYVVFDTAPVNGLVRAARAEAS